MYHVKIAGQARCRLKGALLGGSNPGCQTKAAPGSDLLTTTAMFAKLTALTFLSAALFCHATEGTADSMEVAAEACRDLEKVDLSDLPTAPTQILSAELVSKTENTPAHCDVRGYVAPQVGFRMRLPIFEWNKKFLQIGCIGHCGEMSVIAFCPLRRGYACLTTDAGHGGAVLDGLWGYGNWQAKVDWGYRAPHVVAIAGKKIIERYYGSSPRRSYFVGASTGGRQGLQEAQRFPSDFDGIIAVAPPVDLSAVYMAVAWGWRATHDQDGRPLFSQDDFTRVTSAVVSKCDLDDGVNDGVIGDPLHCSFDPSALRCAAGQVSNCLSPLQIDALNRVYEGPRTSSGFKLSLGGPLLGSEAGALEGWAVTYDSYGVSVHEITEGLRYLFFLPEAGPHWKLSDFNFDNDHSRFAVMQPLYDSSNPNLRPFKAAGGKLMIIQGLNDTVVLPRNTIDYYEMIERTMGGPATTADFVRLYLIPGVEHFLGGLGAGAIDSLSYLESWVEEGKAPDRLIAAHLEENKNIFPLQFDAFPLDRSSIQFTRPVFHYPNIARYRGGGDKNSAQSYSPSKAERLNIELSDNTAVP